MKHFDFRVVAFAILLFALSSCLGGLGCIGQLLGCSEAESLVGDDPSQLIDTTDNELRIGEITFDFADEN